MIDNKFSSSLGTTNFARTVYFLVTFVLGIWMLGTPNVAQAQSIDLGQLQKWQYKGESRAVYKGQKCEFYPSALKRNDRGQFEQDFRFVIKPKKPQDPIISQLMRSTHQLRVKFPSGCDGESKLCLYDLNVIEINNDGSVPRRPESYSIEIVSPDQKPYQIKMLSVFFKGGTTGEKRLYWDCESLDQQDAD